MAMGIPTRPKLTLGYRRAAEAQADINAQVARERIAQQQKAMYLQTFAAPVMQGLAAAGVKAFDNWLEGDKDYWKEMEQRSTRGTISPQEVMVPDKAAYMGKAERAPLSAGERALQKKAGRYGARPPSKKADELRARWFEPTEAWPGERGPSREKMEGPEHLRPELHQPRRGRSYETSRRGMGPIETTSPGTRRARTAALKARFAADPHGASEEMTGVPKYSTKDKTLTAGWRFKSPRHAALWHRNQQVNEHSAASMTNLMGQIDARAQSQKYVPVTLAKQFNVFTTRLLHSTDPRKIHANGMPMYGLIPGEPNMMYVRASWVARDGESSPHWGAYQVQVKQAIKDLIPYGADFPVRVPMSESLIKSLRDKERSAIRRSTPPGTPRVSPDLPKGISEVQITSTRKSIKQGGKVTYSRGIATITFADIKETLRKGTYESYSRNNNVPGGFDKIVTNLTSGEINTLQKANRLFKNGKYKKADLMFQSLPQKLRYGMGMAKSEYWGAGKAHSQGKKTSAAAAAKVTAAEAKRLREALTNAMGGATKDYNEKRKGVTAPGWLKKGTFSNAAAATMWRQATGGGVNDPASINGKSRNFNNKSVQNALKTHFRAMKAHVAYQRLVVKHDYYVNVKNHFTRYGTPDQKTNAEEYAKIKAFGSVKDYKAPPQNVPPPPGKWTDKVTRRTTPAPDTEHAESMPDFLREWPPWVQDLWMDLEDRPMHASQKARIFRDRLRRGTA